MDLRHFCKMMFSVVFRDRFLVIIANTPIMFIIGPALFIIYVDINIKKFI